MREIVVSKLNETQDKLGTKIPSSIFYFIADLKNEEVKFGEEEWLFNTLIDKDDNFILSSSEDFRETWHLNGIIIANNGVGDYLVLLPGEDGKLSEAIFVMLHETAEIKLFASNISVALQHGPLDYMWNEKVFYSLDDDEQLVKGGYSPGKDDQDAGVDDEDAKKYIALIDKRSFIDDLIDDEETGRISEILSGLDELSESDEENMRAWAYYKMSDLYFKGFGPLPKDLQKALNYNQQAIDLGHFASMANRAFCYFSGIGVEKDLKKAYELAEQANETSKKNMFMDAITGSKEKGAYEELLKMIQKEMKKKKK